LKNAVGIKLVAIDLDGTLLDNDLKISPRAKEAIHHVRQKGVEVTLATGRLFASARVFADELGLNLPLVTYQGALVKVSGTGEVLYRRNVPADLAQQVVKLAKDRGCTINFYLDDCVYVETMTPEAEEYARKYNAVVREAGDLSRFSRFEPIKLLVIDYDEYMIDAFWRECREIFGDSLYVTKSMPEYLEFLHPEASKAKGIDAVAHHLGITSREVMAVGDSYNDIDMLEYAGFAVVMGNAREEVKAKADYITRSNEDDGVAEALEMLICGKTGRTG